MKMNDKQRIEVTTLAARSVICEAVSRLASLLVSRQIMEAEEMRLQDLFLHHTLEYVQAVNGPGALEFMVPTHPTTAPAKAVAPASTTETVAAGRHSPIDLDRMERSLVEHLPVGLPKTKPAAE
jgi:hypothetical protein